MQESLTSASCRRRSAHFTAENFTWRFPAVMVVFLLLSSCNKNSYSPLESLRRHSDFFFLPRILWGWLFDALMTSCSLSLLLPTIHLKGHRRHGRCASWSAQAQVHHTPKSEKTYLYQASVVQTPLSTPPSPHESTVHNTAAPLRFPLNANTFLEEHPPTRSWKPEVEIDEPPHINIVSLL